MNKLYEKYNQFEKTFIGVVMCLLIVMGFIQVVFRFVLSLPLAWTEELLTFCMIWVAYLGASTATHQRKHIIVSMFVDLLPKKLRLAMTVFSQFLWLCCTVTMAYLGVSMTQTYYQRGSSTLGGSFPYWVASIIIPISMAIISIRIILLMYHTVKGEQDLPSKEDAIREEMDT